MNNTKDTTPITSDTLVLAGFAKKEFEGTVYYVKKTLALGYFFGKWILMVEINGKPYFLNYYVNTIEELDSVLF